MVYNDVLRVSERECVTFILAGVAVPKSEMAYDNIMRGHKRFIIGHTNSVARCALTCDRNVWFRNR